METLAVVVNGDSMWPTLNDGDTVVVTPYSGEQLEVGNLVVFHDPREPTRICIKRLKRIDPDGYFVEGDNPDPTASTDSHNYGTIGKESIIGFKR